MEPGEDFPGVRMRKALLRGAREQNSREPQAGHDQLMTCMKHRRRDVCA